MSDYIRREDAVEETLKYIINSGVSNQSTWNECVRAIADTLQDMRPADVASVRHGKWLPIVSYNNTYKCSECGRLLVNITDGIRKVSKNYPYCHCGAKMDGKEQNA